MTNEHPRLPGQAPARTLDVWHAAAVCVGMVIGAGIFIATPAAARALPSAELLLAAWVFGGVMSLAGALCFAELAAAFPDQGGDYHFLRRAYGDAVGFLFAWSRFAVIHTGSMALLAFTFGDYLATVLPLGPYAAPLFAAATIVVLTLVNLAGLKFGIGTQLTLMLLVLAGMLVVIGAGAVLAWQGATPPEVLPAATASGGFGAALVFVFLAYGGWSDAATLSAEMRDAKHGIKRALVGGMALVTVLYVLANWAYLAGLGSAGLAASQAPAAELMGRAFGPPGQVVIVAIVALTAITSMNAILIAGARTTYAAARDTAGLHHFGGWHLARGTPAAAIVAIAVLALALVGFGTVTRGGFATMVDYLSPVYWLFLTLSGTALIVLRWRQPNAARPFRVPGYPLVPLVFIASSLYVLYSSLVFVRVGAVVGLVVLAIGVALFGALRFAARVRS